MSVVVLSLVLIFELIQQVALLSFLLHLSIFKILKIRFWTFWRKNCISIALWVLFSSKPYQAFRTAPWKQPRLVKPWLHFDQNLILKSAVTVLLGFLLTHFKSLPEEQEKYSFSSSRHISLSVYLFLDSELQLGESKELNDEPCKYRSRDFLKAIFCQQKSIEKQTGFAWNFLQSPMQVCRGAYISYFKINALIFYCSL